MTHAALATVVETPNDARARNFVLLLLAVSVAPTIVVAAASGQIDRTPALGALAEIGALLGMAHVALTGFFWLDPRYREHIHGRPLYFYALPGALAVAYAAGALLSGLAGFLLAQAAFTAWLMHHFGRQNWGMLCLAAAGTRSGPPTEIERHICHWAPVAAVAGAMTAFPVPPALWGISMAASLALAVVTLFACARMARQGAPALRVAALGMAGLFFLPLYALPAYGGLAIGMAHAYQYAVIMGYLAAGRSRSSWMRPFFVLTAIYAALYEAIRLLDAPDSWASASLIAVQMVSVWHFLVDADVWRLSRPFQRQAVREGLPFLFGR